MRHEPYVRFNHEEMILRDFLAADRTVLANERTLLSYVRTALGFAAGGVSLIHFLDSLSSDVTGIALVVASLGIFAFGIWRYFQVKRRLDRLL